MKGLKELKLPVGNETENRRMRQACRDLGSLCRIRPFVETK